MSKSGRAKPVWNSSRQWVRFPDDVGSNPTLAPIHVISLLAKNNGQT